MPFALPDLPYSENALEPHISAETLSFHYGKHHAGYVDKLNGLTADTPHEGRTLEEVIQAAAGDPGQKALFNNAAQAWNHTFYWNCMTPNGGGEPDGALAAKIAADFGSFKNFKNKFAAAAGNQFGSGWAWLVLDDKNLDITTTSNAEIPMTKGQHALLTCDVWEHAYYLDYQNLRPDYVTTFLENLVNWDFVSHRLDKASEKKSAA